MKSTGAIVIADAISFSGLIQNGLAIVGVLALGFWLVKWTGAFLAKHRELSDIDKELIERLRNALQLERDQAATEAKRLKGDLIGALQKLEQLERTSTVFNKELTALRNAVAVVLTNTSRILTGVGDEAFAGFLEQFFKLAIALRAAGIAPVDSVEWLTAPLVAPKEIAPTEPRSAVLYHAARLYHSSGGVASIGRIVGTVLPAAVTHVMNHPGASRAEISHAISDELRTFSAIEGVERAMAQLVEQLSAEKARE